MNSQDGIRFSIVVPLYNEADSLTPLYVRLTQVMDHARRPLRDYLRGRRQPRRHAAASPRDLRIGLARKESSLCAATSARPQP